MTAFSKGPIWKYEQVVQYVFYVSVHVARSLRFRSSLKKIMYSTMARLCREVDSKATKAVVVETCEWNKILIDSGFLFLISLLTQLKLTDLERGLKTIHYQMCDAGANWRRSVCFALSKKHNMRVLLFVQRSDSANNKTFHSYSLYLYAVESPDFLHILWTKRQMKVSLTVLESPWPGEQDTLIVSTPPPGKSAAHSREKDMNICKCTRKRTAVWFIALISLSSLYFAIEYDSWNIALLLLRCD